MISCKVGKLRRNNNTCIFHTREDFDVLIEANNMIVDALHTAYSEINRLSEEMEKLKAGEQE